MKKLFAFMLSALMVVSLSGCGSDDSSNTDNQQPTDGEGTVSELADEQVFTLNLSNPTALDPAQYLDDNTGQILAMTQEPLFRRTTVKNEHEPGLATNYDLSEDRKTYTFHLRDGLVWSDGSPLTAEDLVYSVQRILDPLNGSPAAQDFYIIKNGQEVNEGNADVSTLGVSAPDEKTFVVELTTPIDYFIELVETPRFGAISKAYGEEYGDLYGTDENKVLASGPFKVESWEQDYQVVLTKNENYWDADNVVLEKIVINMLKDTGSIVALYQTGELSFLDVNADYIPQFENEKHFTKAPQTGVSFIEFGDKMEYSNNEKIREALALTYDREMYVTMMGNTVPAAYGMVPYGIRGKGDGEFREQAGNVVVDVSTDETAKERARALFEEGLAEMGKTQADFEATFTIHCVDSDGGKKGAQIIQQIWKDNLGVNISVTPLQTSMLMPILQSQTFYCVVGGGRSANVDDPADFIEFIYNEGKIPENKEFYDAVDRYRQLSGDERIEGIMEAEKIALETYYWVPQTFRNQIYTYADNVEGLRVFSGAPRFDFKYVQIMK